MRIGTKVFFTAITSLIIGVVALTLIVANIFLNYIENQEGKAAIKNFENASLIMDSKKSELERTELDWTHWDETYQYLEGKDNNYVNKNLGETTLNQLNLYGMIFMDKNLKDIHLDTISNSDTKDICKKIIDEVHNYSIVKNVTSDDVISGVTVIDGKLFLLSIAGITTTDGKAQFNGYLIMIRQLNDNFIKYMENLLDTKVKIESTDTMCEEFLYDEFHLIDIKRNGEILKSKAGIKNILNNKMIVFSTETERTAYVKAVETFKFVMCILIIIFVATIGACLIVINNVVIKKVSKLSNFVDKVMEKNDVSLKIDVSGKDEISKLSNNINNMLEKLDNSFKTMKKNDERLHLIMEATSDGYFDFDVKTEQVTFSLSWLKHLGITEDITEDINQMDYMKAFDYIFEEDINKFKEIIENYLLSKKSNFMAEVRVYKADRGYIWVLIRGKVVDYDKSGKPLRWIGTVSDITERKNTEMENVYLLQTDTVTNLKNRAYMEDILKDLDEDKNADFCMLMADVNGLKLMNDTFGHKEGDRLLSVVGDIFKICCCDTDIPVRWGGDEFLILIKNNKEYADNLLQKIKSECLAVDSFPIKLNLAMGCAAKSKNDCLSDEVIKIAEERMYRNKLLESRSVRNSIISSLEQSLNEKQIENRGHTERVKEICLKIGTKLNLTQDELDELALLSILHDIGKIAIPDYILMKSEKLTEEEKGIMKTHTEIGCRIARSISDLSHISDKILSHHESYDGKGYPRGLSKINIPKASRILAVADSFDIMTYGTIYKESISTNEALKEIENSSGAQFDPEIVKVFLGIYK